jgi:hypothetical protein
MTLIHRIHPRTTRAIFAILWTVVFFVRINAIDPRAMQGNPASNAPKPVSTRVFGRPDDA